MSTAQDKWTDVIDDLDARVMESEQTLEGTRDVARQVIEDIQACLGNARGDRVMTFLRESFSDATISDNEKAGKNCDQIAMLLERKAGRKDVYDGIVAALAGRINVAAPRVV